MVDHTKEAQPEEQKIETKEPLQEDDSVLAATEENAEKRETLEVAEAAREKEYKKPSFVRELFMGNFSPSFLFPFPQQSEEERRIGDEYCEKIGRFLEEQLDPDEVDATRSIPQKVLNGLAKMKMFAIKISEEYGGLGLSQTNYNRIIMKVASYCGSTATLLSAHQSIGVPQPLKMYGTEEQKRRYFPKFSEGAISAFALTEMGVGSDPAKMVTEAKLSNDGTYYILNGEKLWCTNGPIADVIVVMAKTEPKIVRGKEKQQITAFIVETDSPGVELTQRCDFMGLAAMQNGNFKFTNVKIPVENIIWAKGRGLAMALSTLNIGRLTLPGASTGSAKQALSIARRWGNERVQWGQPIGLHEPGREKIAFIAASTLAMEAVTYLVSHWSDQGSVDIRIEAAMAKYFSTETMWEISDKLMQLRGGRGYEKAWSLKARGEAPYAVERMLRDCRVNRILEGTSEIMKLFLAREALDPHLGNAKDLLKKDATLGTKVKALCKLLMFYTSWYTKQLLLSWKSGSYKELGPLERHFKFIEKVSHKMARKLFNQMVRYRQHLVNKQMTLGRLIDVGTDLFVMAATISYAAMLQKQNPKDSSPTDLADHFCKLARRRIEDNFASLSKNDDKTANKIAKDVLSGEMKWLEEGIIWTGPKE